MCIPRLYNWEKPLRERRTQRRAVCSKALSGLPEPKRVLGGTPRFACHRVGGVDRDGAERERERLVFFPFFFLEFAL